MDELVNAFSYWPPTRTFYLARNISPLRSPLYTHIFAPKSLLSFLELFWVALCQTLPGSNPGYATHCFVTRK